MYGQSTGFSTEAFDKKELQSDRLNLSDAPKCLSIQRREHIGESTDYVLRFSSKKYILTFENSFFIWLSTYSYQDIAAIDLSFAAFDIAFGGTFDHYVFES